MRVSLDRPTDLPRHDALVWRALRTELPELPVLPPEAPRRYDPSRPWSPAGSVLLVRHRQIGSEHRIHSNSEHSPRGYELERRVGFVGNDPMPGSLRLTVEGDTLRISDPDHEPPVEQLVLGHIEQLPFVLLEPLELRRLRSTGQEVLCGDPADPIRGESDPVRALGYVETHPISPPTPGERHHTRGLRVLVRRLDPGLSRHVYETLEPGEPAPPGATRLGSVWHRPGPGFTALADGPAGSYESSLRDTARWVVAPVRWAGARWGARAAVARAARLRRPTPAPGSPGEPVGYLRRDPAAHWSPLFEAVHPVVGDRYLSRSALEAVDLGYALTRVAGHVCDLGADRAPGTTDIPWASGFGRRRRYVEGALPGSA